HAPPPPPPPPPPPAARLLPAAEPWRCTGAVPRAAWGKLGTGRQPQQEREQTTTVSQRGEHGKTRPRGTTARPQAPFPGRYGTVRAVPVARARGRDSGNLAQCSGRQHSRRSDII